MKLALNGRPPQPIGWPLLPLPNGEGQLCYPDLAESVRQNLRVILSTRPGEQLMRPQYGAGLVDFIGETDSIRTRRRTAPYHRAAGHRLGHGQKNRPERRFRRAAETGRPAEEELIERFMEGDVDQSNGGGIRWICSFSIPIITICAFIVLNIFLTLLHIVFQWLFYIKVCLPYPSKR